MIPIQIRKVEISTFYFTQIFMQRPSDHGGLFLSIFFDLYTSDVVSESRIDIAPFVSLMCSYQKLSIRNFDSNWNQNCPDNTKIAQWLDRGVMDRLYLDAIICLHFCCLATYRAFFCTIPKQIVDNSLKPVFHFKEKHQLRDFGKLCFRIPAAQTFLCFFKLGWAKSFQQIEAKKKIGARNRLRSTRVPYDMDRFLTICWSNY